MKLSFVGAGSAFTVGENNYQSNMLLESDTNKLLLIDCGGDARFALHELGLSYRDIHAIYISHLHADHVGGLEWLAFTTKFDPRCQKPYLYIAEDLVDDLWNKSLSGGLSSLQNEQATLSTYFDVQPISGLSFSWEGVWFKLFHTYHVVSNSVLLPTYGLYFEANGKQVIVTTDSRYIPEKMEEIYNQSDIIFQDCETSVTKSGVHAHYTQLKELSPSLKGKMWLYHYHSGKLPDAKRDGFRGFIRKGQSFDFNKLDTLQ